MKRKKFAVFVLTVCFCFALAACGKQSEILDGDNRDDTEQGGNTADDNDGTQKKANILVAYFSCTNNTENIAKHVAAITGGVLYEITPAVPYTSADLNYGNSSSRTSIEQNDSACRPAIGGGVENMSEYDTVYLGYPIWWGQAPKILYTFLEAYDFSGKTVVPFCTSASSGVGTSATNLHASASSATWKNGKRFAPSASKSSVEEWIGELGL